MPTTRLSPPTAVTALALMLAGCATPGAPPAAPTPPKVAFPNSVVHELASATGRRYRLWVDLPASYAAATKPLPVVFTADADWAFSAVRHTREVVGARGRNIADFVLVGLVHDQDATSGDGRARDYTPTDPRRTPGFDPTDYDFKEYGQSAKYMDYIEQVVFPFVAANYRVDMARRTYIGHSYGGLFGATMLIQRPRMFANYILGSPSLWFDKGVIFRLEAARAADHADAVARVHMVTGGFETVRREPRYDQKHDLVADMHRFAAIMNARGRAGVAVTTEVRQGEDHLTVFPDVAARGLTRLLPGHGPYDGG